VKLPSKPVIGMITIATVALLTWTIGRSIAAQVMGADQFTAWRNSHVGLFFLCWIGAVIVITLPILWILGTRLAPHYARQEEETAAAKGVGRLAARALEGRQAPKDQLLEMLDDENTAIRCQAARALALLAEPDIDREVQRRVRYWPGDVKLALIDNLGRSRDMRTGTLLMMLTKDRSPTVSRRASTALAVVVPTTVRWDDLARGRKQHLDKVAAKSGKQVTTRGIADAPGDVPGAWEMGQGEAPPMREGSIARPRKKPAATRPAGTKPAGASPSVSAGKPTPGARPRPAEAKRAHGARPANAGAAPGSRPDGARPVQASGTAATRPGPGGAPARPRPRPKSGPAGKPAPKPASNGQETAPVVRPGDGPRDDGRPAPPAEPD